ncbi:hypothetical protein DFP72DRAFT_1046893 [Ephemerocybe angulata]|uniref:Uncharacterized protein n=1 Tax=Ephemerocybe angulata TaxID=980116 RepID=A0A8H6HUI1_9AGAR|nr:hypothetical protein DFP72DRAFT_1046893 [Tulosesus angulatus]
MSGCIKAPRAEYDSKGFEGRTRGVSFSRNTKNPKYHTANATTFRKIQPCPPSGLKPNQTAEGPTQTKLKLAAPNPHTPAPSLQPPKAAHWGRTSPATPRPTR